MSPDPEAPLSMDRLVEQAVESFDSDLSSFQLPPALAERLGAKADQAREIILAEAFFVWLDRQFGKA